MDTTYTSLHRIPPHSIDTERAVLGALIIDGQAMAQIGALLGEDDFYAEAHRVIYAAIRDLYLQCSPIDMITVYERVRRGSADMAHSAAAIESVGGAIYIARLMNDIASAAHLMRHAHTVKEKSVLRALIRFSQSTLDLCYAEGADSIEVLGATMSGIDRINNTVAKLSERDYSQVVYDTVEALHRAAESDLHTGVPAYLRDFDSHTLGLQATDLVILAARPAMGKTAFAVQAAKRQAENGKRVGIFSLEMSAMQLVERILANELRIDINTLKRGGMHTAQWRELDARTKHIAGLPIYLCDSACLTISEIASIAKKWKLKHAIDILYIDYLQLITTDAGSMRHMNREQQVAAISRRLKQLAKELEIPVVALSQLSRAVESRGSKRPMLSDLRESGSIEQDADMVLFLHRPAYYGEVVDENGADIRHRCEILISKFRNGETGIIDTSFYPEHFYFTNKE
jgi:replicative DNA helicase